MSAEKPDWCESHGCLRMSCNERGLHRVGEPVDEDEEPMSDEELVALRERAERIHNNGLTKPLLGVLDELDRAKAAHRKLEATRKAALDYLENGRVDDARSELSIAPEGKDDAYDKLRVENARLRKLIEEAWMSEDLNWLRGALVDPPRAEDNGND